MLDGRAWPKVRDLCMVVAAAFEELEKIRQSQTDCLWVDCLITPVMVIHLYTHAERATGCFTCTY